ncbi:MAG: M48 family metallopeptidase [Nitrospinota bacterium]|nr:M48 family metallopeptidase [Nitrospinota bacterium]
MKRLLLSIILISLFSPYLPAQTTEEEIKVGENGDKYIRENFGEYDDKKIQDYVTRIGNKLLESIDDAEFKYHFLVIEDPALNAFALPGGYIYITTGMLAYLNSEAGLAGILGHEIGHVIGHHSIKQMKKSMGDTLLVFAGLAGSIATGQAADTTLAWVVATSQISEMNRLGYGRDLELQADEFGMIYTYDAGYDPREVSTFFQTLKFKERVSGVGYHGFSATHPDTVERVIKSDEKAGILIKRGKKVKSSREEYIRAIEGLTYGRFDRRKKEKPSFKIAIYEAKEGDTFRTIAAEQSMDESMAFEIAVMNAMRPDDPLEPGFLMKVPVPYKPPVSDHSPVDGKKHRGKGGGQGKGPG